jgi:hypothetical protein
LLTAKQALSSTRALIRAGEQSVRAEIPKRDSSQLGPLCVECTKQHWDHVND